MGFKRQNFASHHLKDSSYLRSCVDLALSRVQSLGVRRASIKYLAAACGSHIVTCSTSKRYGNNLYN